MRQRFKPSRNDELSKVTFQFISDCLYSSSLDSILCQASFHVAVKAILYATNVTALDKRHDTVS